MDEYLDYLVTEGVNPASRQIDTCSTEQMLTIINNEDALVAAAVGKEIPSITKAVDILYDALKQGGRMIYIGAGTSGRLGVLDASECPPTFGTDPSMVQAYIAGGVTALSTPVESCEDNEEQGRQVIIDCKLTPNDVVVGITASGSAPFVLAAIRQAAEAGNKTIGVVTNQNTKLAKICDVCIAPIVGPEVITGSTRMKSGTAQKLVLNMLTTCTMIKLGKVYGNLMVDLRPSNKKLHDRVRRIICQATGVGPAAAENALENAYNNPKLAILMLKTNLDVSTAEKLLAQNDQILRKAEIEAGRV